MGDRSNFIRASRKRRGLLYDGQFSAVANKGETVVICSFGPGRPDGLEAYVTSETEQAIFTREANAIVEEKRAKNLQARAVINASIQDMEDAIQDREVSSIYTIGHGSLASLSFPYWQQYDWQDAACHMTHLKLGQFVQRQCGVTNRDINVPLGSLVTAHPKEVLAVVGEEYDPEYYGDPNYPEPAPVFSCEPEIDYVWIKKNLQNTPA